MNMSEQITPEAAHGFLMREVYVPVFLEKLANDFGIVPQNEEEVVELLKIASHLTNIQEQETVKQAQARTTLIGAASNSLESAMGNMGYVSSAESQYAAREEELVKAASDNLASNPSIQAALAAYHNALAQQLAN
jgi:hypothetical protein